MKKSRQPPREKECFKKGSIEIKCSPIHGYGVFATKDIVPKELIEECPVIIFGKFILEHREQISDREFYWDDKNNAIALGCGSIYNHDSDFNATFSIDSKNQSVIFIATKPIVSGEEVLVDYGDGWFDSRKNDPVLYEPQEKSSGVFKVIILLLFLLVLSKVFPLDSRFLSPGTKNSNQTTPFLTGAF
jgi:uncharacterized protein